MEVLGSDGWFEIDCGPTGRLAVSPDERETDGPGVVLRFLPAEGKRAFVRLDQDETERLLGFTVRRGSPSADPAVFVDGRGGKLRAMTVEQGFAKGKLVLSYQAPRRPEVKAVLDGRGIGELWAALDQLSCEWPVPPRP